jgi:hypothetical protein
MTIKEAFQQTVKLYHFTSFDTAKLILESNCLRYGRLSSMNDIHESDKLMLAEDKGSFQSDILDSFYDEIYKFRQISLSADSKDGKLGFDLHQMWGLYADKGNGVCLVFDKDILTNYLDSLSVSHNWVLYEGSSDLESFCITHSQISEEISEEVMEHVSSIFFRKRKEWEHEQEYRIIKRCPNPTKEEYLFLGKSLKYIILSSILRNKDEIRYFRNIQVMKNKVQLLGNIPILIYGNGLFDYALVDADQGEIVWNSKKGYDILIPNSDWNLAF